ncbi:glucose-6-phosphate isomerase [Rubellicoccus peritrichatus]|uniref:Glucose-6-phosphate isomerase n=1 Tax=Rubellicoccus peritrichatus TaxID=3080537 RepID=A0AAQ3QX86_9BACT|nr:glucose-6-phosphate isomerase [Puniceicoccus sp. CR14]WOO42767.1 glucose-6-phosphate isomerase [Puniceicoccus sp. CR14]
MSWDRFKEFYLPFESIDFALDVSRVDFSDGFFEEMQPKISAAMTAMDELEAGAIANPDEGRMVGHYWLRNAALAPDATTSKEITDTVARIKDLAEKVHSGVIKGASGSFKNLLCIGIGGSALGPQFVAQALGNPGKDALRIFFFDNTDPDGFDIVLKQLEGQLGETLAVVTSKSGGTPETRNGMVEAEHAWKAAGLSFAQHAIAVTGDGSKMDKHAIAEGWIDRFPMWDWVGGRTSELAPVGLVPAALMGIDIDGMLDGAKTMDELTREKDFKKNPAAMLSLSWYFLTGGKGEKDMVILPYKERLALFSKYLQQLVMESLGKELDLDGKVVNQGIAVYGNKGSTDQHAYVQQLRDGVLNFYATFLEVKRERDGASPAVEDDFTAGDFLQGLMLGTRDALYEKGRNSITITVDSVTPQVVGMLIALYERAVGFYGSLVNVNAYHQPGVEAGKKAAAGTLEIRKGILSTLAGAANAMTAEEIAAALNISENTETVFKICENLAANPQKGVTRSPSIDISGIKYSAS